MTNECKFRVIYNGMRKAFPGLRIVSEEHEEYDGPVTIPRLHEDALREDVSLKSINPIIASCTFQKITNTLQTSILGGDIEQDRLVVWIDPLDATQEYTEGLTQVKLFNTRHQLGVNTKSNSRYLTVCHRDGWYCCRWETCWRGNLQSKRNSINTLKWGFQPSVGLVCVMFASLALLGYKQLHFRAPRVRKGNSVFIY